MANIYCTATNTGTGFITHQDKKTFNIKKIANDLYHLDNHKEEGSPSALAWIQRVGATQKTLAEAQAIVDAEIATKQAEWDALSEEKQGDTTARPIGITLKP